ELGLDGEAAPVAAAEHRAHGLADRDAVAADLHVGVAVGAAAARLGLHVEAHRLQLADELLLAAAEAAAARAREDDHGVAPVGGRGAALGAAAAAAGVRAEVDEDVRVAGRELLEHREGGAVVPLDDG
ncbi:MAG: hypothetical protein ACK559_00305, partial [bacterium]